MGSIDKNATKALITFIRNYNDLLEKNLQSIQRTMRETVDGVMQGINDISDKTAAKKREANEVLVATYTNPDAAASELMDSMQDEVNKILDQASGGGKAVEAAFSPVTAGQASPGLARSAGLFSKHMEALETLDGDVQSLLLNMMGALSRDDVISQQIAHVTQALNALQTSLTYMLTDFELRCKESDVERFTKELKQFVFRSYTMEEEKRSFYAVFPDDRPVKAAKAS